ncbi:MAG: hypothetical protein QOD96_3442 [Pseudonocardiales bacterium]|nr:hypothetical protein [Pseudonocardiales bacterium]
MPGTLAMAAALSVSATVPLALLPLAIGKAIDAATTGGDHPGLLGWVGVVLALGLVQAAGVGLGEFFASRAWLLAATGTQRTVLTHAAGLGAALPRKIRTGEVVAVGSSDVYHIGDVFEIIPRATGSLVAFGVVAVALLSSSPLLGTVVLLGVPLATVGIAPLLGPLRRRTEAHREQVSAATSMAADIVSGLRVLRGIGGEQRFADRFAETSQRVRRAGVAAGRIDSWLSGIEVLLPGLVTVGVTWLGARLALTGEITVGQLVAHNQDVLFSGPLAGEISQGGGGLDTVLWAADATEVVDGLPDGLGEQLTEGGRRLSGGQRQRLMLARALSADPDVLVLDEPTSAVDAHTEARICRRVARLRRGRTTVVISHSPLWAAVADRKETL